MTRLVLRLALVGMAIIRGVGLAGQGTATFRSETRAIAVDVAVTDGNRVVTGLGPADFVVIDNGVPQTVSDLSFGRLPIDVRAVFDMSGSVDDEELASHVRAMRLVGRALGPEDRYEVVTFRRRAVDGAPLLAGTAAPGNVGRFGPEGTAFYDVAGTMLMTVPAPGRRQLTVILSDGVDTTSFFSWASLERVVQRTDAVVYVVAPLRTPVLQRVDARVGPAFARLERIAALTGGRVLEITTGADIGQPFLKILNEFRQSYVLSYAPRGVEARGVHALAVSVKGHDYAVRARQGYDGGN